MNFKRIHDNLCQLILPYKDIFTTVYTIKTEKGVVLFDCATFEQDVTEGILPMLKEAGIEKDEVKYVFISHNHRDHAGALSFLLQKLPHLTVISRSAKLVETYPEANFLSPEDGDLILDVLRVVTIPGHTLDSAALLDTRDKTIITGDCFQQFGIFGSEDWAANIPHPALHLAAIDKVAKMEIHALWCAHDYHPIGITAQSKEEFSRILESSREPLLTIKQMILDHPEEDDAAIRERYNGSDRIPTIKKIVVNAIREATENKTI